GERNGRTSGRAPGHPLRKALTAANPWLKSAANRGPTRAPPSGHEQQQRELAGKLPIDVSNMLRKGMCAAQTEKPSAGGSILAEGSQPRPFGGFLDFTRTCSSCPRARCNP